MKNIFYSIIIIFAFISCGEDKETNPISDEIVVKSSPTYNVIVQKDITYGQGLSHQTINSTTFTTIDLKLDAYLPENNLEKRPAILLIHGGGFSAGDKNDPNIVNLANYFASRGWVAFSINYRLLLDKGTVPNEWLQYAQNNLPSNQFADFLKVYPAHRDGKAALRWIIANATNFKIDKNYITVGGGSAGAIIANSIGVTQPEDYTNEISISTDPTITSININETYNIKTILDFWGSKISIDLLEDIYGLKRFGSNDVPILIFHGTEDTTIPFVEAEKLKSEYINSGINYKFYSLDGYGHGAWNAIINGKSLEDLSFEFIVEQQKIKVE